VAADEHQTAGYAHLPQTVELLPDLGDRVVWVVPVGGAEIGLQALLLGEPLCALLGDEVALLGRLHWAQ
jgi:hypothetical protein